jgi:hypothetical protein
MGMTFRTVGAWGSGKGADLVAAEVDENFWELMQRLTALETNAPAAVSIDTIEVNANQMTIHLTDGSTQGPFTLPTSEWHWTGAWRTNTVYFVNDLFSFDGAIYQVLVAHTSDATSFDPNALSGSGYVYNLLLDRPTQPYDCSMFFNYAIPVDGQLLLQHTAVRDFVIPGDFHLSKAFMRVAPTDQILIFEIRKVDNAFETETVIGTVTFDPADTANQTFDGGQFGVVAGLGSPVDDVQFTAGDRLNVYSPAVSPDVQDSTAIGLSLTIAAETGTVS